jgi:hypothetical protein
MPRSGTSPTCGGATTGSFSTRRSLASRLRRRSSGSRSLALAHKSQRIINDGTVESMADTARLGRITRARVTQIMDPPLLAPDLQETLLPLPATNGRNPIHLRELRFVCQTPLWAEQRKRWAELGVSVVEPVEGWPAIDHRTPLD